jgi:DNA-binding transcriptional regulator GbsR (MarR family)
MSTTDTNTSPIYLTDYKPTLPQRKAKSTFWARLTARGVTDVSQWGIDDVAGVLRSNRSIRKWYSEPGFSEWFTNRAEYEERIQASELRALDVIDDIMEDINAKHSDRLAAAKVALELSGKLGKSNKTEKFLDEEIAKMSEDEVRRYLARRSAK